MACVPNDTDSKALQLTTRQVADVSVENVVQLQSVLDEGQAVHLVLGLEQLADNAFQTLSQQKGISVDRRCRGVGRGLLLTLGMWSTYCGLMTHLVRSSSSLVK
jgi:hypothetical protein